MEVASSGGSLVEAEHLVLAPLHDPTRCLAASSRTFRSLALR
jgi:hypothetical protein